MSKELTEAIVGMDEAKAAMTELGVSRVFVLEKGSIALGGTPAELRGDPRLEALYMGETQVEALTGADHQKEGQ